eukprot:120094_1
MSVQNSRRWKCFMKICIYFHSCAWKICQKAKIFGLYIIFFVRQYIECSLIKQAQLRLHLHQDRLSILSSNDHDPMSSQNTAPKDMASFDQNTLSPNMDSNSFQR